MADYVDIATARRADGLRLVLTRMPGAPWTEAAKAVLDVKGIPYLRVAQIAGATDNALRAWTGFANAPVAVHDDERPRAGWREILLLAERLAPAPALIPDAPEQRALMFGLAGELMAEDGLVWNRRLIMFAEALKAGSALSGFARLREQDYGYTDAAAARAPARVVEILGLFAGRLKAQRERGSRFLVGDALSAVDLYWACACAIVDPLPAAQCAMPDGVRQSYEGYPAEIRAALTPELLDHRAFIYSEYLSLPVDT